MKKFVLLALKQMSDFIWPLVNLNEDILKAIKNATGTNVIFPINIPFIHFVFVLTSVPNVVERFTKTWAQLHTSAQKFGKKWQIHQIFWWPYQILKFYLISACKHCVSLKQTEKRFTTQNSLCWNDLKFMF